MQIIRLFAAALAAISAFPALAQDMADRIFFGGPVLTMNDAQPRAEAVAVKDGKIIAVGTVEEIMALKGEGTEVTDLQGRALIPGFVDAHGHVMMGGLQAVAANLLAPPDGDVTDIAALQQTLRDWMAANDAIVSEVGLVIGFGYDDSQLAELRHPTRQELDAVSTDYPVLLVHQSSHLGAMNSKALEMVGYTRDTPNPAGGVIRRDANGDPDGVLEENALYNALPKMLGMIDRDGFKSMAIAGSELWASFGYTTADEGSATPGSASILKEVAREGGFKIDIAIYPNVVVDRDYITANYSPTYEGRARVAGAKLVIDGSPQGFTAFRDRPYYAPVGNYPPGYRGYSAVTEQQTLDALDWAYANDIPILTHSNGEAASDMLIAAVGEVEKAHGNTRAVRPVLIHGQFLREDQVDSVKRLGIFPSLFPMHTFYWGDWHRDHTIGPVNAENISPTGWMVQRGMMFASHHDAPVAFPDSMRVLDATVTRRTRSGDILGPAQRVDVITALKAMTLWPAWSHHEEDMKGSVEVGKLADLVILSGDPTAIDPETLDSLTVAETIKEGTTIYVATQKEGRLQYRPMQDGTDPFARFLSEQTIRWELAQSVGGGKGIMDVNRIARQMAVMPHNPGCVANFLTALLIDDGQSGPVALR